MSDVKKKFEEALAQRKKQKAEEASRGSFSGGSGFPDIPYAPLYTDKQQAFRFVGLPYLVREKSTDSKRVHIAMILGDDDKKFRCIGPDPQENKDWYLYRVMNKVLSKRWDKNAPGVAGQLGAYVYDYASTHPELFNRVAKNNNVDNAIERGWKFNPFVLFNVIDRANYAWHTENRKFRVLSKKASEWQDRVFFEPGVPDTLFQLVMDDIVAIDGNTNWEDYDIVVKKVNDKPWYKVYHGIDDAKKLDDDVKTLVVTTGVTKEEQLWELNDFDKLFPVTRYAKIKSRLGLFIQKVDKVFNTRYYEELLSLVEKEEVEIAEKQLNFPPDEDDLPPEAMESDAENNNGDDSQSSVSRTTTVAPSQPASPASPPVRASSPAAKVSISMTDDIWVGLANGTYNGKQYLGVPKMKPEEKALVLGIYEDGSFEWSPEAGELYEGASSQFLTAEKCKVDPLNGETFD